MAATDLRATSSWIAAHDPLSVTVFTDPVIERLGHDVRSSYVETFWLPILGPSAVWAARRMVDWLDTSEEAVDIPLEPFGRSLGLGGGVARSSPLVRTLTRLVDFGLASTGGGTYSIRRMFPPLSARHVRRLPAYLVTMHALELEAAR